MTQQHLTLKLLIQQVGLTTEQVAQLRLSHLHLAEKEPNISFIPENEDETRAFLLDLDTHRMLVSWLVARPDSVSDFLFPGEDNGAMPADDIEAIVIALEDQQEKNISNKDDAPSLRDENMLSRPVRPLSRPEVGAPPPGFRPNISASMFSPSSAPETEVNSPKPSDPPQFDTFLIDKDSTKDTILPASELLANSESISFEAKQPIEDIISETEVGTSPLIASNKNLHELKTDVSPDSSSIIPDEEPSESETDLSPASPLITSDKTPPKIEPVSQKEAIPLEKEEKKTDISDSKSNIDFRLIYGATGIGLLFCVFCLVGGGVIWQFVSYDGIVAVIETEQPVIDEEATPDVEITPNSPVSSPTHTPTDMPTLLPTETPSPAITNTPKPTATIEPTATNEPTATETMIPTDTPTLEPTLTHTPESIPTSTIVPTSTPTDIPIIPADTATPEIPIDTPTPARGFDAPKLLDPDQDSQFIRGNTIILRWKPVGELLENEYYAVRLRHRFQGEELTSGDNVTRSEWTIPLDIIDRVDGPDNRFEWFVIVEQDNGDDDVRQISPQSETRIFTWR
ncbi:hypothetical protein QUF63_16290 [Anaerolineales bacterium HSG25]|nr:hypothetical protein [Anaerolineales bacterium HSG25]